MRFYEWGRIVKGVNTTADVDTNSISREAGKFGNKVDKDGRPPTLSKKVKGSKTNVLFNLGMAENKKLDEKWSAEYKRSIDCSNPKGFSQKAHCAGRNKNEAQELASTSTIYVDMDGVLADFFGDWAKLMGKDHWTKIDDVVPALQKIRDTENFWLNLPLTSNAKNLLMLIKDVKGEYNILSSPLPDDPNSEPHKREWIEKNLGFFPPKEVIITHDKAKYATTEDGTPNILIDDYGVNIQKWEAAGGIGFKHKDHKFERTAKSIKQHIQEPVTEAAQSPAQWQKAMIKKYGEDGWYDIADAVRDYYESNAILENTISDIISIKNEHPSFTDYSGITKLYRYERKDKSGVPTDDEFIPFAYNIKGAENFVQSMKQGDQGFKKDDFELVEKDFNPSDAILNFTNLIEMVHDAEDDDGEWYKREYEVWMKRTPYYAGSETNENLIAVEDEKDNFSQFLNPLGADSKNLTKIKQSPGFHGLITTMFAQGTFADLEQDEILYYISKLLNINTVEIKAILQKDGFDFTEPDAAERFKQNMDATGGIHFGKTKTRTLNSKYSENYTKEQLPQLKQKNLKNIRHTMEWVHVNDLIPVQEERVIENFKRQVDRIVAGKYSPIIVDCDNKIVNGHHRYEAAKLMGYNEMAVAKLPFRIATIVEFYSKKKTLKEGISSGVIFLNDKAAVVGQTHNAELNLSPDTKEKIKDISNKYGAWSEGSRTDEKYTKGIIDNYKGSWDDIFAKSISGYPYEFLYVIMSNIKENNRLSQIGTSDEKTIFEKIIESQSQHNFFKDRRYNDSTLKTFLEAISDDTTDFVELSGQIATTENLTNFLEKGESLMWPESGWESYSTNAGKVAQNANNHRDKFLATRKEGVYVVGSGHLVGISNEANKEIVENFADGKKK